jgi:hypothetical protein
MFKIEVFILGHERRKMTYFCGKRADVFPLRPASRSVLVVVMAFVATAPLATGLSAPLLPRGLPRALPMHQLHVPGAQSNHPARSADDQPAHVFAGSLRLVVSADGLTAVAAANHAAAATTAVADSAGANATVAIMRRVWRVYRGSAEVATLEVGANGELRTAVHDASALQEESAKLAARAWRYFGVPAKMDLVLEPLALVAALAAQQHRQQQLRLNHPQHEEQPPPAGQLPPLPLVPLDALSGQLLATAQRLGW